MANGQDARRKPRQSEFVYFVKAQVTGLIKIGISCNMDQRLRALQIGSPDRLSVMAVIRTAEPKLLEQRLHSLFHRARRHGEWFEPRPGLLAYVAEHGASLDQDAANVRGAQMADWIARGIVVPDEAYRPAGARKTLERYKAARGLS